jgi:hypothetical protein
MEMSTLFLFCAVIGGTLLACQALLAVLGLGGHHVFGDHDFAGDHSDALAADHDFDHAGAEHDVAQSADHGGASLFRILTFRAVTAALAFFGLTGLATRAADWSQAQSLTAAVGAGALAMWGVHQLMRALAKLRADGTIRLREAVGRSGSVYLRIPTPDRGVGKVHITLRNQTVELSARSASGEIVTGRPIRVLRVLGPDLVEVEPRT